MDQGELKVNLLFFYEGEAENHSLGFEAAVRKITEDPLLAATWLPRIDLIFISNKYEQRAGGTEKEGKWLAGEQNDRGRD